jgi:diguanylate cyclase (GGDEF)-like protein
MKVEIHSRLFSHLYLEKAGIMERIKLLDLMFYKSIPKKYQNEFKTESINLILERGRAAAITILCFEIFLLLLMLVIKKENIFDSTSSYYASMYSVMIIVASSFLLIYRKISDINFSVKYKRRIIVGYTSFILYWSAAMSILDQITYGQILVYIIAIIAIAEFTCLEPVILFPMFLSCQVVFVVFLPIFQGSTTKVYGNIVNSTIFVLLSLVIARMLYKSRVENFINRKTIEENNEALNEINRELQEANETLEKLSITDALSDLNNRRKFDEAIALEWNRCKRHGVQLSILFIDIDYFKLYNDNYGHQSGDVCIKQIAKILKGSSRRASDFAARYGGEEFVVVLSHIGMDEAYEAAESIRKDVESLKIVHDYSNISNYVTVSLGIYTCVPTKEISIDEFIGKADKALYMAKKNNRNQVYVYKD